jgi:hypothetical protein
VLGGVVAVHRGAIASLTAAFGTAIVTLPLFALGGTVLRTDSSMVGALLRGIQSTLTFGILPLGVALVLVHALARRRQPSAPTSESQ